MSRESSDSWQQKVLTPKKAMEIAREQLLIRLWVNYGDKSPWHTSGKVYSIDHGRHFFLTVGFGVGDVEQIRECVSVQAFPAEHPRLAEKLHTWIRTYTIREVEEWTIRFEQGSPSICTEVLHLGTGAVVMREIPRTDPRIFSTWAAVLGLISHKLAAQPGTPRDAAQGLTERMLAYHRAQRKEIADALRILGG